MIPPIIPPMPNVRTDEWDGGYEYDFKPTMAVAYMTLFPAIQKLHLKHMYFGGMISLTTLLSACGRLKVLSFLDTIVCPEEDYDSEDSDNITPLHQGLIVPTPFDLTELEELAVTSTTDGDEYLIPLVDHSPPAGLKFLTFGKVGDRRENNPCSLSTMEKLLRLGAHSVVDLRIDPTFQASDNHEILKIFKRLPAFSALDSLTIWLSPNRQAELLVDALTAAPNLNHDHLPYRRR
ncbi:hypothetical protein DFH09DRAFT_628533 [Mycena vulgaris]|nr:hypothetical protein DFH09DRAFT_628533 [Mycena vulgaris]